MWWCSFAESRIGRQSNAVKHATFLQLSRIKCAKGIISSYDPFALSSAKLDLTVDCGSGNVVAVSDDSPDFTVTTSHDSRMSTEAPKKPRRPYKRRRSTKVTTDSSNPPHYTDDTQACLSPIEIKQETASPVECDTNEPLDLLGVELVQDSSDSELQQSTEKHPERQPSEMHSRNVDSAVESVEYCCYSEPVPTGDFQDAVSDSVEPQAAPVPQCDFTSNAVAAPLSSQTPQPHYEDVVKSMQMAYYDLLPILQRVRDAALSIVLSQ